MSQFQEHSMKPLDQFYNENEEPVRGCLQALRSIIAGFNLEVTEHKKYGLPFFYYKNKPFCYLWIDKVTKHPYIGVVKGILIDHPMLEQGNRKKMKILSIDPTKDIDIDLVKEILDEAVAFY